MHLGAKLTKYLKIDICLDFFVRYLVENWPNPVNSNRAKHNLT